MIENRNRTRRPSYNRNQKIRPSIGLLASSLRTFINNDITTEYTTEIYGTTLDHGNLYAQLISTTSRIRTNPDITTTSSDFDNHIDLLDKKETPYFIFPTQVILSQYSSRLNTQTQSDIKYVIAETAEPVAEKLVAAENMKSLTEDEENELLPKRITPTLDLPTVTVKNNFLPGEVSVSNRKFGRQNRKITPRKANGETHFTFGDISIPEDDLKTYETVRYYGFADFTTIVDTTVIIFSPYTSTNVIELKPSTNTRKEASKIDPTVSKIEKPSSQLTTNFKLKSTNIASSKIVPTYIKPTRVKPTYITIERNEPVIMEDPAVEVQTEKPTTTETPTTAESKTEKLPTEKPQTEESITEVMTTEKPVTENVTTLIESNDSVLNIQNNITKEIDQSTYNDSKLNLNREFNTSIIHDIEPTESITENPLTVPSEEDVLEILASLAKFSDQNERTESLESSKVVESNVFSGATTIFFDDGFEPTTPQITEVKGTQSVKPTNLIVSLTVLDSISEDNVKEPSKSVEECYVSKPITNYKTVTYLTTFFEPDSSTNIETNVITTSEIDYETSSCHNQITPSSTLDSVIMTDQINEMEPTTDKGFHEEEYEYDNGQEEGNDNDDDNDEDEEIELIFKTLYTTYTYLTTYFQDSTPSVASRKETVTNIITSTLDRNNKIDASLLSKIFENHKGGRSIIESTKPIVDHIKSTEIISDAISQLLAASPSVETIAIPETELIKMKDQLKTVLTTYTYFTTLFNAPNSSAILNRTETFTNYEVPISPSVVLKDAANISLIVTNVLNSSSDGDRRLLSEDDQLSLESNNNSEAAPVLLAETKFTTYTYYTTMYDGTTSSNIVSRLETSTNVVTKTVNPNNIEPTPKYDTTNTTIMPSSGDYPITFFTTFTYWTTLFIDGTTTVTSQKETISSVSTPMITPTKSVNTVLATLAPSSIALDESELQATFFTTYTYYTTSYAGDKTVINSRLDTVSNIVKTTADIKTGRAIDSGVQNFHDPLTISNFGDEMTVIDNSSVINKRPLGVLSRNHGRIVDADNVSSILYTTEIIGTIIDDNYVQAVKSTSTVKIDEERIKSVTPQTGFKTGLIRVIDGTILENETTTLYQSKVVGTVIDGIYAQIIESTSSFIAPTKSQSLTSVKTLSVNGTSIHPTIDTVEGSTKEYYLDESMKDNFDDKSENLKNSRLIFKPKKSNFSLQIRPFASRNRATFNPKKRNFSSTPAATITRSDVVTPTVVATPVTKYASNKKTSSYQNSKKFNKTTSLPNSGYGKYKSSRISQGSKRSSNTLSANPTGTRFRINPTAVSRMTNKTNRISSTILIAIPEQNHINELTSNIEDKQNELSTNTETIITKRPINNFLKPRRPLNYINQRTTRKPVTTPKLTTTARPTTKSRLYATRSRPTNFFIPGKGFQHRKLNKITNDDKIEDNPVTKSISDIENEEDVDDQIYDEGSQLVDRKSRFRQKRQTSYPRFRRPITHRPSTESDENTSEEVVSIRPKSNTYTHKQRSKSRITPSKVSSSSSRVPFTLRDNSRTNGYSRRTTNRGYKSGSTAATTTSSRGYKKKSAANSPSRRTSYKPKVTPSYDFVTENDYDNKVVVTYSIPTETTIPVFNGKITEYKTVVVANLKTETLSSNQFFTNLGDDNKITTVLSSEMTAVNQFGATEVTKFLLHGTPTTKVTFTPTNIRGRKTTFSHIIPSTIYNVENIVTTIQPQLLVGQAPLANILLSQLLLGGNLNQQTISNIGPFSKSLSTEYKTRTTTYVTTVTSSTSTVVPLIFRGRQILTTIVDSSIHVLTATEFITDTILVTPTAKIQDAQQLNSLLLPLLLQQQQNQQYQSIDYQQYQNELLMSDEKKHVEPMSSVITVYLSGRKPGEFSTSLSTLYLNDAIESERFLQKREIFATKTQTLSENTNVLRFSLDGSEILDDLQTNSLY